MPSPTGIPSLNRRLTRGQGDTSIELCWVSLPRPAGASTMQPNDPRGIARQLPGASADPSTSVAPHPDLLVLSAERHAAAGGAATREGLQHHASGGGPHGSGEPAAAVAAAAARLPKHRLWLRLRLV